jgi:hypothetical protein
LRQKAGNRRGLLTLPRTRKVRRMKEKRDLSPKILRVDSRIRRARKLADASLPLVADLYVAHMQACADNQDDDEAKRKRRKKRAPQ